MKTKSRLEKTELQPQAEEKQLTLEELRTVTGGRPLSAIKGEDSSGNKMEIGDQIAIQR